MVLFILALIWAAVLLPPYLQNRSNSRPADSITSFRNQLSVLGYRSTGASPQRPAPPQSQAPSPYRPMSAYPPGYAQPMYVPLNGMTLAEARRRRREVFYTLVGAAVLTLVLALALGGSVWVLHLAVDLVLGAYVTLLVQVQQRQVERAVKVRHLTTRRPRHQPEPVLALRRSVN